MVVERKSKAESRRGKKSRIEGQATLYDPFEHEDSGVCLVRRRILSFARNKHVQSAEVFERVNTLEGSLTTIGKEKDGMERG